MNKKLLGIVAVLTGCFAAMFALTGCEALGLEITSQGIRGDSNVLMLGLIAIIVLIVVVQRLLQR